MTQATNRTPSGGRLSEWLERAPVTIFSVYAVSAAFITYFCMYAFRKPFAAGTYEGLTFGPLDLKDALIISQVIGYALSKWLGIKFVSEMPWHRRALAIVVLVLFAETALIVFAVVPPSYRVAAIFFNGLPLGAIWGLVFGFLEGRRTSEILGAGLSCAYIVASGFVKTAGLWVKVDLGVPEPWMPAMTGLIFLPVLLVAVWALKQLPQPNAQDRAARTPREPMYRKQRMEFIKQSFPGLLALTGLYFFLTAYRDFRDNYAVDIWAELGMGNTPAILTQTELPIALAVMFALTVLYLVKNNRLGLLFTHLMMFAGSLLIGVGTLLYDMGVYGPVPWMIVVGLGLYLAYVPYGCVLFDRLIAATGVVATAVFMIYVTDAVGYVGSIGIILYKTLGHSEMSKPLFFRYFSYFTAAFCSISFALSAVYFARKSKVAQASSAT